jgi:hypothetical protein
MPFGFCADLKLAMARPTGGTMPRRRRLQPVSGDGGAVMQNLEEQLAAIGFGRSRKPAECWRSVRLDRRASAAPVAAAPSEPACSRPLLRWRDLLARGDYPSPYRISRI